MSEVDWDVKLKKAHQTYRNAHQNLLSTHHEWAAAKKEAGEDLIQKRKRKADTEGGEAPADQPAAVKKAGKGNKSKKEAKPAPPKKEKKEDDGNWACDGNVITGEPHPEDNETDAHKTRAPNTKHDGKTYTSCKACKKAIKKSKAAAKDQ